MRIEPWTEKDRLIASDLRALPAPADTDRLDVDMDVDAESDRILVPADGRRPPGTGSGSILGTDADIRGVTPPSLEGVSDPGVVAPLPVGWNARYTMAEHDGGMLKFNVCVPMVTDDADDVVDTESESSSAGQKTTWAPRSEATSTSTLHDERLRKPNCRTRLWPPAEST